ncbi:hypothetical protein NUACC26_066650 [Scytonema sp. NUACC26]
MIPIVEERTILSDTGIMKGSEFIKKVKKLAQERDIEASKPTLIKNVVKEVM